MPLFSTDWENGITDLSQGHDLRFDLEAFVGVMQARHYFFLKFPVPGGEAIWSRNFIRGFKWQIWEGNQLSFEQEVEITINVTGMSQSLFGIPVLSFLSYMITKEKFKTTVINGEATDEVAVVNLAATSGRIEDFEGNELTEEQVAALQNPSFAHTLGGAQTSEFGIAILDSTLGLGTDTAFVEGRYELPVYYQNAGPNSQVDIVFDSLQAAGRADLYQFRFGGTQQTEDVDAFVDAFEGMGLAALPAGGGVSFRYGGPHYNYLEERDFLDGLEAPSAVVDRSHHIRLAVLNPELKVYEELISKNGGHKFEPQRHGLIIKGLVSMPQERIIDRGTDERGVISFEGNTLTFRRSGDNFAAPVPIVTMQKPEPFALTVDGKGVLRASNGKGALYVSYNKGGSWRNKSKVPVL